MHSFSNLNRLYTRHHTIADFVNCYRGKTGHHTVTEDHKLIINIYCIPLGFLIYLKSLNLFIFSCRALLQYIFFKIKHKTFGMIQTIRTYVLLTIAFLFKQLMLHSQKSCWKNCFWQKSEKTSWILNIRNMWVSFRMTLVQLASWSPTGEVMRSICIKL